MKFDVHLYAVVRVKVTGIEADSHREAALRAEAAVDLDRLLETCQPPGFVESISDADEIVGFMVDQISSRKVPSRRIASITGEQN